jgi:hypothetical protein
MYCEINDVEFFLLLCSVQDYAALHVLTVAILKRLWDFDGAAKQPYFSVLFRFPV